MGPFWYAVGISNHNDEGTTVKNDQFLIKKRRLMNDTQHRLSLNMQVFAQIAYWCVFITTISIFTIFQINIYV